MTNPEPGSPTIVASSTAPRQVLVRAATTGLLFRGVSLLGGLALIPLAAHALSPSQFQVALVLATLVALVPFGDLGVSLALLTLVPTVREPRDQARLRSSAYLVAGILATALGVVLALVSASGWLSSLLVGSASLTDRLATLAVALAIPLSLLAGVRQRMLAALQRQAEQNLISLFAALVGYVIAGVSLITLHSLPAYLAASTLLPQLVVLGISDSRTRRILSESAPPRWRDVKNLLAHGAVLTVQGVAIAIAVQSDVAFTSALIGKDAASNVAMVARLVGPFAMILAVIINPLWPVFSKQLAAKEFSWVVRTTKRVVVGALLLAIAVGVILLVAGQITSDVLTQGVVVPSVAYWTSAALWVIALAIQAPLSMFVNARAARRLQLLTSLAMLLVNLPLTVFLILTIGGPGALLASAIAYGVAKCIPYGVYFQTFSTRHKRSLKH